MSVPKKSKKTKIVICKYNSIKNFKEGIKMLEEIKRRELERVANEVVEVAYPRNTTCCKCCGRTMEELRAKGKKVYHTKTSTCNSAYVCEDCIKIYSYGTKKSDLTFRVDADSELRKKATQKGKFRVSIEWEGLFKEGISEKETMLHFAAQWKAYATDDSSLNSCYSWDNDYHREGLEVHVDNALNGHGDKDFIEDIANWLVLDNKRCGQHINLSKTYWKEETMEVIRNSKRSLFNPLTDYLKTHEEDTIKVFGRFLNYYACDDDSYSRNYCHPWLNLDNTNWIEFRLPHFVNVNQMFYCICYCKDVIEILDKWLKREVSTEKASEKMIHEFKKYAEGRACCQRAERNKIDR